MQYTTGVGVGGGALLDGWKGRLLKGWTITGAAHDRQRPAVHARLPRAGAGTGVTGALRPSLTGASLDAPAGYYLNPAAYAAPAPGEWGNAGRNSVTGPAQFAFNAGVDADVPVDASASASTGASTRPTC